MNANIKRKEQKMKVKVTLTNKEVQYMLLAAERQATFWTEMEEPTISEAYYSLMLTLQEALMRGDGK